MKKRVITTAAATLALFSVTSGFSQNPICPIGTYIADPAARVWDDGKIYVYGSTDISDKFYCSYKHDVLYSSDMKKWDIKEDVMISVGKDGQKGNMKNYENLLFAPDAMYKDGKYYLYFCGPNQNYAEGVAWSESPLGPFKDAKPLDIKGPNQIDPTIFIDDDGEAYYFWGQFALHGAKVKPNMTELDKESIQSNIINSEEHYFHEGSFMFKRNGTYYIVYAHEGRRDNRPTCLGYSTSDSPMGPYKYGGVLVDNFGCDPESWNNHGSVAKIGDQWYVFYHRSSHASNTMRRACVEPIYFNEDGSINEVEMTSQGASGPLSAFETIEAERACLLGGYCYISLFQPKNETIRNIKSGDSATYKYIDFTGGATKFNAHLISHSGGIINIRLGGADGRIIGTLDVPQNSSKKGFIGKKGYYNASCDIERVDGIEALYLEFIGKEKGAILMDLDNFSFE